MPASHPHLSLCLAAIACTIAGAGHADSPSSELPPPRFSAEAALGFEYDSNVSVEEVDRASNESDYALTVDAGVELEQDFGNRFEAGLNYDYSRSNYQKFSEVDRQTHILGANATWHSEHFDTDVSAFYIHSSLDGKGFLELARLSPAVSGFLSKRWFARGSYVYQDKRLENQPMRDAVAHAAEFDLYFFAQGLRRYFNVGYRYKDEDAEAAQLDYRSNGLKVRYVHRLSALDRLLKLEFSWRYEDRDYRSVTPSIDEKRDDQRHRLGVELEIPLTTRGAVQLHYTYADYNSNLERVDYSQDVAGARLIYRW